MQTVHIMSGLPASGKSTFAKQLVEESNGRVQRVNLDDIRAMIGGTWTTEKEDTALDIQDRALRAILDSGQDAVVDNTHLTPRIPKRLKTVSHGDAVFKVHDLTWVPQAECIRRDAERDKSVGEDVIARLADSHQRSRKGGWRLTDEWMNDWPQPQLYVPDLTLPSAVLCDIDGTLALMDGRGPYEFHRVYEDKVNESVARVLHALYMTYIDRIILLSGRDESCRSETDRWLQHHNVPYHELHMRASGDRRPDYVVKIELFEKHIRSRFNVVNGLDDRDSVVAGWRKRLGLPTWQVNYGNF